MAGSTRETVTRTVAALQRRRLLIVDDGRLVVTHALLAEQ